MIRVRGRVPEHKEDEPMKPHWGYLTLYLLGVLGLFWIGIRWSR